VPKDPDTQNKFSKLRTAVIFLMNPLFALLMERQLQTIFDMELHEAKGATE
jgi:hypothetical protein